MSRALGVRLLLTLVALGCLSSFLMVGSGVIPSGQYALTLKHLRGDLYRIEPQQKGLQPSGLQPNDLTSSARMTPAVRALLFFNAPRVPVGTRIMLPIARAGQWRDVTLTATAGNWTDTELIEAILLYAVIGVTALLTLWRGKDWSAWALSGFLLFVLAFQALNIPLPPSWALATHEISVALRCLLLLALFVFADTLAGACMPARLRTAARIGVGTIFLALLTVAELQGLLFVITGKIALANNHGSTFTAIAASLSILSLLLTVLVLIGGYRWGAHQDRLRLRWVLWCTALLGFTMVGPALSSPAQHPYVDKLVYVLQLLALIGYLYAILRTRVVDVGFVVDRALVYGVLTALVFGTFSVLEQSLHEFAISDKVGWAVQAVAALVLALILSPLHRRLENWIEQAFFRNQRLALLALERLARECPFVERETHLLAMAVERLQPQCAAVAIYERTGNAYRRRHAHGGPWPEVLDADDPTFIALRATHEAVPLAGRASGLGSEGIALPMTAAQSVLGALVCRPRDGEQFAAEIRAALANVAHHLGMALIGLRHREHARLVADVAAGRIDADAARRRAITLLEGELPQIGAAP